MWSFWWWPPSIIMSWKDWLITYIELWADKLWMRLKSNHINMSVQIRVLAQYQKKWFLSLSVPMTTNHSYCHWSAAVCWNIAKYHWGHYLDTFYNINIITDVWFIYISQRVFQKYLGMKLSLCLWKQKSGSGILKPLLIALSFTLLY